MSGRKVAHARTRRESAAPTGSSLAPLLRPADGDDGLDGDWSAVDLREMLDHALASPVACLAGGPRKAGAASVAALLAAPRPALAELGRIKDAVKQARGTRLPRDVARALYFLAVGAARHAGRGAERITRLSDAEARSGLAWIVAQGWIGAAARDLAARLLERPGPAAER